MLNIVLFHPQIPQNTGNIARTCAVTGTSLHLIHPLGFSTSDKSLKRAGLDYWRDLRVYEYENFNHFLEQNKSCRLFLITSKGDHFYTEFSFQDNDYFIFGSETAGLPEEIHAAYPGARLRIPMLPTEHARCLNLSNAVNVILYEALRQTGFQNLK